MSRNRSFAKLAVAVVLVAASSVLSTISSMSHHEPIEHRGLIQVALDHLSFTPLDSHDAFLRGTTGEMIITALSVWEDGHETVSWPPSPLIENISAGQTFDFRIAEGNTTGALLYTHDQCHPVRPFWIHMRIIEDDSPGEIMKALIKVTQIAARAATGRADQIVAPLVDVFLEETGLRDEIDDFVDSLSASTQEALGREFGSALVGAASLLTNRALRQQYDKADARITAVTDRLGIASDLDSALSEMGTVGVVLDKVLSGSLIDQGIEWLASTLTGSGPEFVGEYHGAIPAYTDRWSYTIDVVTGNYSPSESQGAGLRFGVRVAPMGMSCERCNRAPSAVLGIEPSEGVMAGNSVELSAANSTDPDLAGGIAFGERLTYAWGVTTPEGETAEIQEDGGPGAEGSTASFTAVAPGEYTISLTVTDACGATSSITRIVEVLPAWEGEVP